MDEKATLVEQGIDSIMAVDIRTWFLKELDIDIPILLILSATATINELVERFMNDIPPGTAWVTWEQPGVEDGKSHKPETFDLVGK